MQPLLLVHYSCACTCRNRLLFAYKTCKAQVLNVNVMVQEVCKLLHISNTALRLFLAETTP